MKKLRKFAALVMALMMFATLLAACGDTNLRLSLAVEGGVTSVAPGGSAKFTATVVEGETDSIVYSITAGSEHATIDSSTGDLDVLPTAQYGATISVVATSGEVTSNTVSITVASPSLTSVTISANASDKVVAGQQISFSAVVAPSTISGATVVYTVNGAAAINGNVMTVNADAAEDSVISVKATATYDGKSVESNTLTFTVIPLTDTDYSISIVNENLTVDKYGTAQVIEAEIYDGNHKVEGVDVSYQITSGSEYIDVNYQTGSVTAKGHGTATVTVSIAGTTESATCTINSIVPPDAISMPSNLPQDDSVNFAVGLWDYSYTETTDGFYVNTATATLSSSKLKFEPSIEGTNVCQDYTVTFLENDVVKDDIAEYDYETKEITFKRAGTFTISIISDSGSAKETPFTRELIVNNGINVDSMAEFLAVMNNYNYQSDTRYQSVNLFSNLTGFDGMFTADSAQQTVDRIRNHHVASFGDRYIYGNNFDIDLSNIRILSYTEYISTGVDMDDFLNFQTYGTWSDLAGAYMPSQKLFTVELYDLSVKGNLGTFTPTGDSGTADVTDENTLKKENGTPGNRAFRRGVNINAYVRFYGDENPDMKGELIEEQSCVCKGFTMKNVTVNGFYIGTALTGVTEGEVTDCVFTGSYAGCVDVTRCQIVFENIYFGQCGVSGIELTDRNSDKAGENFDEKQSITFKGEIVCENLTDGSTPHMKYDDTLNQFNALLMANLGGLTPDARSNFLYPKSDTVTTDQINWFVFIEGSDLEEISDINFVDCTWGDGDVITTKDTESMFMRKAITMGGAVAGYIYVVNPNYVGA